MELSGVLPLTQDPRHDQFRQNAVLDGLPDTVLFPRTDDR
jgi:hypothetical protein